MTAFTRDQEKKKTGTERIGDSPKWEKAKCLDPEHNPAMFRVYQPGQYRHTCPRCGNVQNFFVPGVVF